MLAQANYGSFLKSPPVKFLWSLKISFLKRMNIFTSKLGGWARVIQ